MNEKKICFIICSSNRLYTEECLHYINHLNVPEGYQVDALTVEDAKSMASGYNEGMQASDAKYKVYLHQDVFIINHNFIPDILDIFQKDSQIGMIGMIGSPKLPANGIMWEGDRCGAIYVPAYFHDALFCPGRCGLTEVEAVDGLLMATQYDIPWREDLFDKWDFYDCSQSQEFLRRGYKVVVPDIEEPWCYHDSTLANLSAYEGERLKFQEEYFGEKEETIQEECKVTVVVTSHDRMGQLQDTVDWLERAGGGISNIIIADNGSRDGSAQWLSGQRHEYVWFDEGTQGYGKLWNAVLENFETEDCIVFLEAGVYPEKRSLCALWTALQAEDVGIASPVTNFFFQEESGTISGREALSQVRRYNARNGNGKLYHKSLRSNWKMWAVRKDTLAKVGHFKEELKHPEEVLTDYSLRLIQSGLRQDVCRLACAYESFFRCSEVYKEAELWQSQDRIYMKMVWGMNYFNLRPNQSLVARIQEERDAEFTVLEVGCDLGATLYEIQDTFPGCTTYGIDINEAAVKIAKHLTQAEYGNIDELTIPFGEKFDYIIFGDVLEHLRHPEEVVAMCRGLLKEGGRIIASIPNVMHISVMEELIEGRFRYQDVGLLDRTHIHFFTYYEIMELFRKTGYKVEDIDGVTFPISEKEEKIMETLLALSDNTEAWMYKTFQYVVRARKQGLD